jgi:hypothetical protein
MKVSVRVLILIFSFLSLSFIYMSPVVHPLPPEVTSPSVNRPFFSCYSFALLLLDNQSKTKRHRCFVCGAVRDVVVVSYRHSDIYLLTNKEKYTRLLQR